MNLADYLRRQFAYDEWANREVLSAIRTAGGKNQRSLQLMSHVLATEMVWLDRLKEQPQSVPVWPEPNLEQCESQAEQLSGWWRDYLDLLTAGDIAQSISYKNTKGEHWTNSIMDILTHVLFHSAYHRGQIASHMRESGENPLDTDFIHAVRQGFVK